MSRSSHNIYFSYGVVLQPKRQSTEDLEWTGIYGLKIIWNVSPLLSSVPTFTLRLWPEGNISVSGLSY